MIKILKEPFLTGFYFDHLEILKVNNTLLKIVIITFLSMSSFKILIFDLFYFLVLHFFIVDNTLLVMYLSFLNSKRYVQVHVNTICQEVLHMIVGHYTLRIAGTVWHLFGL